MTTRDAIKAGVATALITAGVLFGASLTGWLQDVLSWAQAGPDEVVVFPDPGVLAKAAVAAVVGAAIGLVNTLVRLGQRALGLGSGPVYQPVQFMDTTTSSDAAPTNAQGAGGGSTRGPP